MKIIFFMRLGFITIALTILGCAERKNDSSGVKMLATVEGGGGGGDVKGEKKSSDISCEPKITNFEDDNGNPLKAHFDHLKYIALKLLCISSGCSHNTYLLTILSRR